MRKSEQAEFLRLIVWLVAIVAAIGVGAWAHDWWEAQGNTFLPGRRTHSYSSSTDRETEPAERVTTPEPRRQPSAFGGSATKEETEAPPSKAVDAPQQQPTPAPKAQRPSAVEPLPKQPPPQPDAREPEKTTPPAQKPEPKQVETQAPPSQPTQPEKLERPRVKQQPPPKPPVTPTREAAKPTPRNMDDRVAAMLADLRRWKSAPDKRTTSTAAAPVKTVRQPEPTLAKPAVEDKADEVVASAKRALKTAAEPSAAVHKPEPPETQALPSQPKQPEEVKLPPVKQQPPPKPSVTRPRETAKPIPQKKDDRVAAMLADLRRWKSAPAKRTPSTAAAPAKTLRQPEPTLAKPAVEDKADEVVASAKRALEAAAEPPPTVQETSQDVQRAAKELAEAAKAPVEVAKSTRETIVPPRPEPPRAIETTTAKEKATAALAATQTEATQTAKAVLKDAVAPEIVPPDTQAPTTTVRPEAEPDRQTTPPAKPADTPPEKAAPPEEPKTVEADDEGPVPRTSHRHDQVRYHFDPLGTDRQLLDPDGQPVPPAEVPTLYKVAFAVYDGGLDVCSYEYAAKTSMPEGKRPVFADLSSWEDVRVPAGQLAIDPRLGRFQFSAGKTAKVKPVGRCHIAWGEARDVFLSGNYAYLATAESTYPITIYDLADPTTPVKVGMVKAGDMEWPTRVVVHRDRLYIPSRFRSLGIVDVSNPTAPRRLAELNVTGADRLEAGVRSVVIDGEYAYLTIHDRGVAIWHIPHDDPSIGLEVGSIPIRGKFNPNAKPRITKSHLLLVNADALHIYNVANPEKPTRVTSARIPRAANLQVRGTQAFVACGDGTFVIVDIADLRKPKVIGKCRPVQVEKNGLDDIALDGNFAYVTVPCQGDQRVCFAAIDISQPTDPAVVSKGVVDPAFGKAMAYGDPGQRVTFKHASSVVLDDNIATTPTGITARDGHVYVSDLSFGLWVFDVSDPRRPRLVGGAKDGGEVSSTYIYGDRAYVAQNMRSGVSILDLSSPSSPRQLAHYHTGTHVWACPSFYNEYLYFSGYADRGVTHLHVLDVTTPTAPRLIHKLRSSQDRSACLVCQGGQDLLVIDGQIMALDDPAVPKPLSQVPKLGRGWGLRQVAVENRLYVCRNTELAVVDITDPSTPTKLGSLSLPSPGQWETDVDAIRVANNRILVPHGDEGLFLIDISDETAPKVAAHCTSKAFKDSHRSFLSKLASKLVGDVPWSTGAIMAAEMVGSTVYVADYRGYIYELSSPDLKSPKVLAHTEFGRGLDVEGDYLYRTTLDGLTVLDVPRPSEAPQGLVKTIARLR